MESNIDLAALRKSWGMTQTQMAARLGMTQRALLDIETGKARLRRIHVLALERLSLDVAVELDDASMAIASAADAALGYSFLSIHAPT